MSGRVYAVLCLLVSLAGCVESHHECGSGRPLSYAGDSFCVFEAPLSTDEFECPGASPMLHEFDGVVVCAQEGALPEGFEQYARAELGLPPRESEPQPQPPPPPEPEPELVRVPFDDPSCNDVVGQDYCVALYGDVGALDSIAVVGLEDGSFCTKPMDRSMIDVSSLGWLGDELYACTYDEGLARISLRDGSVELAEVPCSAVTDYEGQLLVTNMHAADFLLTRYPSFEAVINREDSGTFEGGLTSRIAVHGSELWSAWHSAAEVAHHSLTGSSSQHPLPLEREDRWIHGLDISAGGELVVVGGFDRPAIEIYDPATGALKREFLLPASAGFGGISCVRGQAPTPSEILSSEPALPTAAANDCDGLRDYADDLVINYPPSSELAGACGSGGYTASSYRFSELSDEEELHVIGVYEAERGDTVRVRVEATGRPVVLALSSYEHVDWQIDLAAGAVVSRVLLRGYERQTVSGLSAAVPVQDMGWGCGGLAYGWEARHNIGGGDYRMQISEIRATAHQIEDSFQGCYSGIEFTVPYWD